MKVLQVTLLLSLIVLLLGCGENAAPTPNSSIIALPTAVESADEAESVESAAVATVESAEITSEIVPPDELPTTTQIPASSSKDSANHGRLLVVDPQNQIVTINPDGSDMRQLTNSDDGIIYIFPAWSPDNQSIAAIGAGNRPATDGVYVFEDSADLPANRVHTSDEQQPIYLSWSPDSENVSFIAPRGNGSTLLDLRVVQRDGEERSRYLAFGQPFYWDWNSTGDEIVFNAKRTTHAQFAYLNPANGEIGEDVATTAEFFQSPDLSHDDVYLAYSVDGDDETEIIIENRATNATVSTSYRGLTTLAWSPTINHLAYIDSVGQTPLPYGSLHLLNIEGQDLTLIPEAVIAFFWSPDGTKIAYLTLSTQNDEQEAQRGRFSSKSTRPFFQTNRLEYQLWVVEVVTAEPQLLGSFRPSNLFVSQFIPFFGQYAHSHSIWSPDSRALALPIETEDGSIIYRFPVNGEPPTVITPGRIAFWTRN